MQPLSQPKAVFSLAQTTVEAENVRTGPHLPRVVAVGVLTAYSIMLLLFSGREGLWGDEGFTARMVDAPLRVILHDLQRIDVNMSVYYVLVHVVTTALGTGERALRLLSVVAVVAAVCSTWRLVRDLFGPTVATAAAVLLALNPFVITLGLTARPYGLLLLLSVLTAHLALLVSRSGTSRAWLAWSALCAVMLYVHLLGALLIAAQCTFVLVRRRRIEPSAVPAAAMLVLAAVPTVLFLGPANTLTWIGEPTVRGFVGEAVTALGGKTFVAVEAGCVLVALAIAVAGRSSRTERTVPESRAMLTLWVGVPLVCMLLLTPVQSLFVSYYFTPVLVPTTVGVAVLLLSVRHGAGRVLCVALAVSASLTVVQHLHRDTGLTGHEDWARADRVLDSVVRPQDTVVFPNAFYRIVAEYYAEGDAAGWTRAQELYPPASPEALRPYRLDEFNRTHQVTPAALGITGSTPRARLWLVSPAGPQIDLAEDMLVAAGYAEATVTGVPGVRIEAYDPPPVMPGR